MFKKIKWKRYALVCIVLLLILGFKSNLFSKWFSDTVEAVSNTYYVSPNGSDTNSGAIDNPFATFNHAFSTMQGGDTLIVIDGVYTQPLGEWRWSGGAKVPTSAPPSGTAANYTTVKAQNIRGTVNSIDIIGSSYIKLEGFKSLNGVDVDGSNHIELRKIGAKGGVKTARSSYVTKEDVWAWNDNQYVIHNYSSDHIIDNRVIARIDEVGAPPTLPVGAISHYLTDYSVIANTLLFDVSGTFNQPYDLVYSSRPNIGHDQLWGVIGFNAGDYLGGIYPGDGSGSNYEIHNSVIWGTPKRCIRFNTSGPHKVENSTCGANGGSPIVGGVASSVELNNNIFYNNNGSASGVSSCNNNIFYNSGDIPGNCTNTSTVNPNIEWLPRSPIAGKGATIENKYTITEVNNRFVVNESNQKLWPWPYEDLIKQDMCEGVTKGWCGTNKTLTQYVWEYLGTPCPTDICVGGTPTPDTTNPTAPTSLGVTAVSDSQIDLTWSASTDNVGVTGYKIYRNGTQAGTSATTFYSDEGLTASTTYTYTISAYDAAENNSDMSNIISATTKDTVLPPPPTDDCTRTTMLCVDDTSGATQEYPTIQGAASVARPGDTVLVHEGTYAGFQVTTSGTQAIPIIFQTSGTVTINTGGPTGDGIRLENASYITLDGFHIENVLARCIAARGATPTIPMKGITIKNNICVNSTTEGFYLSELNDSLIEQNTITNSGNGIGSRNHGIYLANAGSDNTTIRGNTITQSSGESIHVNGDITVGGDGIVSGLTIEQNTLSGGIYNGLSFDGVQDSVIQNNLVYGNSRHALRGYDADAAGGPKNLKIINNTFTVPSTGGWAIKLTEDGGGHVIFNNILLNESTNGSIVVGNTQFTSNYNILANKFSTNSEISTLTFTEWQAQGYDANSKTASGAEVFVNAAANNYRLKDGGVAIDAGGSSLSNVSAPSTDLEGTNRPQGVNFDAGAYEKTESVPPSPDTTPPTGTVIINNGATSAGSSTVILTLSATDNGSGMGIGAEMKFSNDTMNWSQPEAYATSKTWTLSGGDGTKTVYVKFKDVAGNWMATGVSDTIQLDNTAPIISNVQVSNITARSATVAWTTNEPSTSQIEYGISVDYDQTSTLDPTLMVIHNQNITGLNPETLYHFRVRSKDGLNNQSFSSDQSFTTLFNYKQSDINRDKKVDQLDFDALKRDYGRTDQPVSDLNQNGIVDSIDLGIMMSEWDK